MKPLSKSNYTIGIECPGHLWLQYNDKEKIPPHPPGLLKRFEQGTIVGQWAKKLFPDGVDIPEDDFKANLEKSKELLKGRKILFEAAVQIDNVYGRADILVPVGKDEWDVIEVKSGTKVDKKKHYWDVSFQLYVYRKAGLKIRNCFLMHLNKEFVRDGEIDVEKLFHKEDITSAVEKLQSEVPKNIEFLWEIVKSLKFPNSAEKNHCTLPKKCHVKEYCWGYLPEHHVFHLYNGRKNRELYEEGIIHLHDVPDERLSNPQQAIQKKGKLHIDKKQLKEWLDTLDKVELHLDFEFCGFAVPEFDGTRAYQRLPFQFSLHVVPGEHFEYLHDGNDDPRLGFLKALKKALPNSGSVIVYSQGTESSILRELARDFPEYQEWAKDVISRMVDLRVPFSKFWYYNPVQKGSASIKKVLPTITGKGYSEMNISDGECAAIAYLDMNFGKMSKEKKEQTRKDLLAYCELDTKAMVWIVDELKKVVK